MNMFGHVWTSLRVWTIAKTLNKLNKFGLVLKSRIWQGSKNNKCAVYRVYRAALKIPLKGISNTLNDNFDSNYSYLSLQLSTFLSLQYCRGPNFTENNCFICDFIEFYWIPMKNTSLKVWLRR